MDTAVATYMTEVNTAVGANTHKVAYKATETAFGNVITAMGTNATCTAEKLCKDIHTVYDVAKPEWTDYITKKLALAQLANSNKAMELSASAHQWTLHGLWPTDIAPVATALATDFTTTVKAAVEPVIKASWPNCMPPPAGTSASNHMRKFWQHEWANHGIYYRGRSPASYVEDAVHLLAIKREFCTQAVKKLAATPVPQASLAAGRHINIDLSFFESSSLLESLVGAPRPHNNLTLIKCDVYTRPKPKLAALTTATTAVTTARTQFDAYKARSPP